MSDLSLGCVSNIAVVKKSWIASLHEIQGSEILNSIFSCNSLGRTFLTLLNLFLLKEHNLFNNNMIPLKSQ